MTTGACHVRIFNTSRGVVLAERCPVARTFSQRNIGLLRTELSSLGDGLFIERSPSIHMFFMSYPIDAIFVDRSGRVVRIAADLKPWRIVAWARGARDCYEAPAGTATRTGTRVGDQLEIGALMPE
jgi:uncharacterized membrane protein (UPF0127 family)